MSRVDVMASAAARTERSLVVYDANTFYSFGSYSPISYAKSSDGGASWATAVDVLPPAPYTAYYLAMDIYYARWTSAAFDPLVHIVGHSDSGTRGIYYCTLDLATDTVSNGQLLVGWSPESFAVPWVTVTVTEAGRVHVICRGNVNGASHFYSDDNGATWTGGKSTSWSPTQTGLLQAWPDVAGDTDDLTMLHPIHASTGVYMHRYDNSANTWSNVTISATHRPGNGNAHKLATMAWERSTGKMWLMAIDDNDTSPRTILCWEVLGATVTARTNVVTDVANVVYCGSMRLLDGRLVGLYVRGNGSDVATNVYYRVSADDGVTWGSENRFSDTAFDFVMNVGSIQTDPSPVYATPVVYHTLLNTPEPYHTAPNFDYAEAPQLSLLSALTGTVNLTLNVSGVLTGVSGAAPPILVRCRELDGVYLISGTLDSRTVQ